MSGFEPDCDSGELEERNWIDALTRAGVLHQVACKHTRTQWQYLEACPGTTASRADESPYCRSLRCFRFKTL